MKILAIDCSATPASVALTENPKIIGEFYINTKLTHSQTLMPMVDALLKATSTTMNQLDAIAVNVGPGSFTGIRIGVSAVKGMAMALNIPCVEVSTLESMAHNIVDIDCVICAVMDARCNQVYNALFELKCGKLTRICDDRALAISDLIDELKKYSEKIVLVGDGAELCFADMQSALTNITLAPENLRFQRASSTAACTLDYINNGMAVSAEKVMPKYLRLPQAQRELKKKQQEAN